MNGLLVGQPMPFRKNGNKRLAEKHFATQQVAVLGRYAAREADVYLTMDEGLRLVHGIDVLEREVNSGLALSESTDQAGEEWRGCGPAQSDRELSKLAAGCADSKFYRALRMLENLTSFAEEDRALRCHRNIT